MEIMKRMSPPNNLQREPYKTQWYADLESGLQIWIQCSPDQENPKWRRLGDVLEELFDHLDIDIILLYHHMENRVDR